MRIVIDMQGAQTESRFRGIGRYAMGFAHAVVRNRGEHEIILALSGLFPETIEPIRAAFDGLLPQENIRVWHAPGPVAEGYPGNDTRREAAELIREAFLARLQPDVIHLTSLFEGYVDDAVTSVGRFDTATPVSVTLYDLIPLLNPDHYFKSNQRYQQYYLRKIEYLKKAALHLAISEFSRQESINALDTVGDKTIAISTALDSHFQPQTISDETATELRARFSITRPFVLYTGGSDERKNLPRLIEAYASQPVGLREAHQLLFAGKMPEGDIAQFKDIARSAGLKRDDLLFTGFVSDEELIQFYNLCQLYVFPSWHEGFGLPALEAMACGAPVIGANTTSLPEAIGLDEALFDPFDVEAISAKLNHALEDELFRNRLREHGLNQSKKFSWDQTAKRAISAMERLHSTRQISPAPAQVEAPRERLAYVSPLPPERTGIADYSAELLPALARHYNIEVIVTQETIDDPWININLPVRSVQWFIEHADHYDRVVYHFGNSAFHKHMFDLLKAIPGVVVLHDFFLSHVLAHIGVDGFASELWAQELYYSHGYKAMYDRFNARNTADVIWEYPCSLSVIQNSLGLIVHSPNSLRLAHQWYGKESGDWAAIPLVRSSSISTNRAEARKAIGLSADDFLVCTFGMLWPAKLNHRLLKAWLESELAQDGSCHLVFVGENHPGDYGQELITIIRKGKAKGTIRITGWADREVFQQFLAAADTAVQLRTLSRGETSAAVLDCMNYGLPTIVNANGSMVDLEARAVWKLPDEFTVKQLIEALETLWHDSERRQQLGNAAREIIIEQHDPRKCADLYRQAIEKFYHAGATSLPGLPAAIAGIAGHSPVDAVLMPLAEAMALSFPPRNRTRQLLIDISRLVQIDAGTGIQRVVRNVLKEWLHNPPEGYRIEPVYAEVDQPYRYARRFMSKFLAIPENVLQDEPIDYAAGDVFLGLDWHPHVAPLQRAFYQTLRRQGVKVEFVVYDLLCVLMPQCFPPESVDQFASWLEVVAESDGAVCISQSVARELSAWMTKKAPARLRPFHIGWFHLGAKLDSSHPTSGLPQGAKTTLAQLQSRSTFLMVSTIEPRKGHAQVLDAFEQLWSTGVDVNLAVVGKQGWMVDQLIKRLNTHSERDKRLFWLEGISDEYLEKVYNASSCLIAASYGEGFGLPLIEAAKHKLPVIARGIPVFREVAGEYAFYFKDSKDPQCIAETVLQWLELSAKSELPRSDDMPWLTWEQSAQQLLDSVLEDRKLNQIKFEGHK